MAKDPDLRLITVQPMTRINDGWIIADRFLHEVLDSFDHVEPYCNFDDDYTIEFADKDLHQSAFLHVVTETIFDYPHNANGEKTMKPIAVFRPFVLVSVPGALQDLKDLGFQTFDRWWDESYDQVQDPTKRLYAIMDIVQSVCATDVQDLRNMLGDMREVLIHNYNHYYKNLLQDQLIGFDLACQANLAVR